MQDNPRVDRTYDRTRVDGDSGIQRGSSIVLRNLLRHHDSRPSGMNLDFIPRDYLVFLHPVEPIADVGILTVAGLNTVRITDQRQQVSIAVIGKETFDVLFV